MGRLLRFVVAAIKKLGLFTGDGPAPLFVGSFRQFLNGGLATLEAKRAEASCAPTALTVIESLIRALPDLDLDASRLTVEDQCYWVTLPKDDPSLPTALRFEAVSSKPLSLSAEWYPPGFWVADLDVTATDPRKRFGSGREIRGICELALDNDYDRLRQIVRDVVKAWPEEPAEEIERAGP